MRRSQRIHLVGGFCVSLLGVAIVIVSMLMFAQRMDALHTTLETAEDVTAVTAGMRDVFAGPGPLYYFGLVLIPSGVLYALIVLAVWFIGPSEPSGSKPTIPVLD